ncbi:subclass B1 metallo-beta-lactamase [Pontibacter actiniarum]|uniref:beta-lactamase n=1 Tax=Pontibacter actiniarum TaxID=323450 RepID=A0A1X9YVW6_9BACT|nr:subclass B1 metallo-beta-lactamase [Pontibacter actiniarum]ARS37070.1 subclass B1 metallo-beta-lactamase [Pontibacter actiniarum]
MKRLLRPFLCLLLFCPACTLLAQAQQLQVTKIAPNVYVHTTYSEVGGVTYPSHGLVVSTKGGAVLIDTGWGNAPTEHLLAWIADNLKQPVTVCVATHWHEDKMGGAEALQAQAIPLAASELTAILAVANKKGAPDIVFETDTTFTVGKQPFEVYYPGGGHTADNVVVYLPRQKILFGGCLVKDLQANNLGNVADADLKNWPFAIQNLQQRYPEAKVVVPSHGPWGDRSLLNHTLKLLQHQKK